jgi:acyl-coenzyme A synthetase/AMP-(fatty) acid ligase/3-hydroxymyristoyl/3-hydroxydecanoyl-(acyl carrier protein) dehydratase
MLPLLARRDLSAPLLWRRGEAMSAGAFIAQALALAERLPARGRPVNLCQDRGHFALALAAALLRGQTSLLPPNALPATLAALAAEGSEAGEPAYALVDDSIDSATELPADLPTVHVATIPALEPATAVPGIEADLPAVRLLTSGSTGTPQPHGKRFGQLVLNIGAEAERLAEMLERPSLADVTLVGTVPAQHSYGMESTVLLALLGGAAFEAGRPFYPADIVAALAAVPAPRALVSTPFHLKTLLASGLALPHTALILSATAPLTPQLAAQAEAASGGGRLIEIYGCTEAGQVATRRTTEGEVWWTMGALRLSGAPARTLSEAPADATWVHGGHVLEPTPLADVIERLDATHFRLFGRAGDVIHVGGKRSSIAHLNFQLNRIPGVEDGAFWLPDGEAQDGEQVARPVAFVVAPGLSAADVAAGLRQHLEPVFVPRRIVFLASLPREGTGKITQATLRALAEQHLVGAKTAAPTPPAATEFAIAADHPACDGHFPGQPLLPGAMLLSLVFEALASRPDLGAALGPTPGIANVKFLRPVRPGQTVRIAFGDAGRSLSFEAFVRNADGEAVAARGQLAAGGTA